MAGTRIATRPDQSRDHRTPKGSRSASTPEKAVATSEKSKWEQAVELFARAEEGDKEAFDKLKKHPELAIFISVFGLTSMLEGKMADQLFGTQCLVAKDGLKTELRTMQESLLSPGASPLESLLATEVALAWVVLRKAQMLYEDLTSGDPRAFQMRENRLNHAMSRYLSAIRTFAQIRRLQIPMLLQMNVANQQVNLS